MNERIGELATEAGGRTKEIISVHGDYHDEFQLINGDIEKFAELIVKECIEIVENSQGDADFAIWKLKKDFGVE